MTKTIHKIISVCLALAILAGFSIIGFAADKTTIVTVVCKVSDSIETDDYSPVIVKLMNEETYDTYEFSLYKYNSFSERYEMKNGNYTIVYARIDNRNDIIFEVKADDSFSIGKNKTIYFELYDSNLIVTTKEQDTTSTTAATTETTAEITSTTEEKTLHTLYDNSQFVTESDTVSEESEITSVSGQSESQSSADTVTIVTTTVDEISSQEAEETMKASLHFFLIFTALAVLVFAAFFTVFMIRRKR